MYNVVISAVSVHDKTDVQLSVSQKFLAGVGWKQASRFKALSVELSMQEMCFWFIEHDKNRFFLYGCPTAVLSF